MKFLVEKVEKDLIFDFTFILKKCKEYYDWLGEELEIKYCNNDIPHNLENPDEYIPVGSIEFVSNYLKEYYPNAIETIKPINVPESLFKYAGRKIVNCTDYKHQNLDLFYNNFEYGDNLYRKSNKDLKDPSNGIVKYTDDFSFVDYQVSEVIDVLSEWRIFVHHNEIKYISNYGGDPTVFPDLSRIYAMISDYSKEAPVAYTLDVGIGHKYTNYTFIMEVHRFFSCGLYGFSDLKTIPIMLAQTWNEMKRYKKKD